MAFKFLFFAAVVAVASAGVVPAQYSYGYDVQDPLRGDVKSQQESRVGDVVQGQYSFVESDGTRRTVDYAADPINGFNAVVRKDPLLQVAPIHVAAPVVAAPIYAAPSHSLTRTASFSSSGPSVAVAGPAPIALAAPIVRSVSIAGPLIAPGLSPLALSAAPLGYGYAY